MMAGECKDRCEYERFNCGGISMPVPCGGCCECMGGCALAYPDTCSKCGWPVRDHWVGKRCPKPARELCGQCDAGLPMACTCVETPKDPSCCCTVGCGPCPVHPDRQRTKEQKIAFRIAWDEEVDRGRRSASNTGNTSRAGAAGAAGGPGTT